MLAKLPKYAEIHWPRVTLPGVSSLEDVVAVKNRPSELFGVQNLKRHFQIFDLMSHAAINDRQARIPNDIALMAWQILLCLYAAHDERLEDKLPSSPLKVKANNSDDDMYEEEEK